MVQTKLRNLDVYDDFEDGLTTGRTSPYPNIVPGVGTTAISSTSPISGTYSLTHLGSGSSGSGNNWKYESSISGIAGPFDYEYTVSFDVKMVSYGAGGTEPAGYLWFPEYTDSNNYSAFYTSWNGTNQIIRLFQKVAGTTTTLATYTWLGAKWAVGATYHMTVQLLDNAYKLMIGTSIVINPTSPTYLGATTYHGGGGGDLNTKLMWDNIWMRTETAAANFVGTLPVIGAIGSELDISTVDPISGATDDSTLLTFNQFLDFPVQLEITNWDNSIFTTKPFIWKSTNTYQLGYEGLDQYMSLRVRVYAECTSDAAFNIYSMSFTSE